MNHRELLVKYLGAVLMSESYDYLPIEGATPEEQDELSRLSKEACALLDTGWPFKGPHV